MKRPKVLRSIETRDGALCVDIFERTDGSYGFEEYRKDPEDPRGWFSVGSFADVRFDTAGASYAAALRSITWLGELEEIERAHERQGKT